MRVDPAGDDHGEVAVAARGLLDLGEQRLEGVLRQVDLVHLEAEVAAGQRSLEDDRVRALPLALPAAADEIERARRGDDRHQRGVARLLDGGQRQRQPRAGDDGVGPGVDGRAHRGLVVALERDHDVDPGEAPPRLRERDLLVDGVVGARLLAAALGDEPVEAGAREHPEPPRGGDRGRQRREGNPDAHPPLDDRQGEALALDGQRRQCLHRDKDTSLPSERESKTLPGLRMPAGSKTRLIPRISSRCRGGSTPASSPFLSQPMPCSPESTPPSR